MLMLAVYIVDHNSNRKYAHKIVVFCYAIISNLKIGRKRLCYIYTHLSDSYYATHTYNYYNMSVNFLSEFYFVLNKVPMRESSYASFLVY